MTDGQRLGPPPIEPMSDIAWSRVERGLWSRMDAGAASSGAPAGAASRADRAPWRWWLIAAPLAAAAIIAIVVGLQVLLLSHRGEELTRIRSPGTPSGPSSIMFEDSHIELDPDTALATGHEAGHPLVLLEHGAAWFSVSPRRARSEFVVRAGDAVVRVVGTRFRVERADERITVRVDHGAVDVLFRGRIIAVPAGTWWSSESPASASILAANPPAAAPAAAPEPPIDPQPAAEPPLRTADPKRTAKPAGKAPVPPAAADPAARAAEIDRERTEYERLAALEPSSPEAAQRGYVLLAQGSSRWASLALYAAGRLAADRHDRRAETLLGMYLERFPTGPNAEDARRLLARLKADSTRGE